ncbi:hypothetical protein LINPERPRIM_LOCUS28353 [Linum perenne]
MQFKNLCSRDWTVKVIHTFREGNQAADFVASAGYDYPYGSHSFPILDKNLGYFLRHDCMGISEPRSVLIND